MEGHRPFRHRQALAPAVEQQGAAGVGALVEGEGQGVGGGVRRGCHEKGSAPPLGSPAPGGYFSSMLRSIHAVFSCTCMRWVSRTAVVSSLALSTTGMMERAIRNTAPWPYTHRRH